MQSTLHLAASFPETRSTDFTLEQSVQWGVHTLVVQQHGNGTVAFRLLPSTALMSGRILGKLKNAM